MIEAIVYGLLGVFLGPAPTCPTVWAAAMRLNLGCGRDVLPGWVNVNASDQLGPGVEVWDLDEHPWPFEDGSASEIRADRHLRARR